MQIHPVLFFLLIIGMIGGGVIAIIFLFKLIGFIIDEIDLVKSSYFGWKKIKHDLGTYYLILDYTSSNYYNIKISKYPLSKFYLKLENREENIRLVKGKISETELANIKNYVNKFITDYHDFISRKDVLLDWDGNLLSKKGQRKENLNKIIS